MNRITNKEYLIDITIKTLQTQQPNQPSKVKCEVHYGDDSFLRIPLQPLLRNGQAFFCDERLKIPFSSEVSLVFKLIKSNKKEIFLGHYSLEVEKMLSEKQFHFKVKDKLQQADAWVDFECKIIDKQLLCQSDNEQFQLDANLYEADRSIITSAHVKQKIKVNKPLSQLHTPVLIFRKSSTTANPLPPEQFGKIAREAEDILKKRQIFSQRHHIISNFSRDKYGMLRTSKIQSLQNRLNQSRKQKFNNNLVIYGVICLISFILGMQI